MTTPRGNLEVHTLTVNSAAKIGRLRPKIINSVGGGSIQLGGAANAEGDRSIALGVGSSALGEESIAIGSGTGYYKYVSSTFRNTISGMSTISILDKDYRNGECSASGNGAIALGSISTSASGENSIAINTGTGRCATESSGEVKIARGMSNTSGDQFQAINGPTTSVLQYSNAENGATLIGNKYAFVQYSSSSKGGVLVGVGSTYSDTCYTNGDNSLTMGSRVKNSGNYSICSGFNTPLLTEDNTLKLFQSGTPLDVETKLVAETTATNLSDNGNSNNIAMPPTNAAAVMEVNLGGTLYKIPLYL